MAACMDFRVPRFSWITSVIQKNVLYISGRFVNLILYISDASSQRIGFYRAGQIWLHVIQNFSRCPVPRYTEC